MSLKRQGEGNPFYGKKHTDETKSRISELNKGLNSKISVQIGKYDYNKNLIMIYGSMRLAEKDGYNRRKFSKEITYDDFVECNGFLYKKVRKDECAECKHQKFETV